jgi:protein SCO1/2
MNTSGETRTRQILKVVKRYAWLIAALALALIALHGIYGRPKAPTPAAINGSFSLVDQDGKRVTQTSFRGKIELIYFGYTHCPDVCPTSLNIIAAALKSLGLQANEIEPIFITLDPERDTREVIGEYVSYFVPGMRGLTGTSEEIAKVTKEFGIYYSKAERAGSDQPYTIDHANRVFLMDRQGRLAKSFSGNLTVDQIVDGLRSVL